MTKRMIVLDGYCKAGGAGAGYARTGAQVIGIDIAPQPHYPFEFVQGDAVQFILEHGHEFDFIHTSPPCQRYSCFTPNDCKDNHPDLIAETRRALRIVGKPYVIENVPGARDLLINPLMLCGSMFGLPIERHRYFEYSPNFIKIKWGDPLYCRHIKNPVLITDHGGPNKNGPGKPAKRTPIAVKRAAAEINWMNDDEISESIPPVYTEWIFKQFQNYYR